MAEEFDRDSADEKLELSMMDEVSDIESETGEELQPLDGSFLEVPTAEHTCGICEKSFSTKYNLGRHIRLHDGHEKCNKCGITCDSHDALQEHMSKRHSHVLICEDCGVEFMGKQALRRHRIVKHKLEHEDKKECPYETCTRVFAERHKLQHHINTHLKIKPYKCSKESCNKCFSSSFDRNRHSKTCGEDRVPSFVCDMCNKTFSSRQAVFIHNQAEHEKKTFLCTCGKNFKYITGLYRHRKANNH